MVHRSGTLWWWAVASEGGLALLAYLVGWLLGFPPHWLAPQAGSPHVVWALIWGLLATGPLIVLFLTAEKTRWPPLVKIRQIVAEVALQLCGGRPWWQVTLLAVAAGVGEEVLFRGWLQTFLPHFGGHSPAATAFAIFASAAVFGGLHAVTPLYFVLATGVGIYLGVLYLLSGHLVSAIVCHAVYDLFALLWLTRNS